MGFYKPMGSMIFTGLVAALGLPIPALFSALTRKMYSLFSITSLIIAERSCGLVTMTGAQLTEVLSRSSITYDVISDPPSNSGGSQETVAPNLLTFPTITFCGGSGTSGVCKIIKKNSKNHWLVCIKLLKLPDFLDLPNLFLA